MLVLSWNVEHTERSLRAMYDDGISVLVGWRDLGSMRLFGYTTILECAEQMSVRHNVPLEVL